MVSASNRFSIRIPINRFGKPIPNRFGADIESEFNIEKKKKKKKIFFFFTDDTDFSFGIGSKSLDTDFLPILGSIAML